MLCARFFHFHSMHKLEIQSLSLSVCVSTYTHLCLFSRLYATGGCAGHSCLKSMEYSDPHTTKWSLYASMSKIRGSLGVTTYNGFLFVGGHDSPTLNECTSFSNHVER